MQVDRQTIRALSADTRITILKRLAERKKMPAELSKELELAPSTVVEHLQKLEHAGLVQKRETGHKWVYYEITRKGRDLTAGPQIPVNMIIALVLGIALTFAGVMNLYTGEPLAGASAPAGAPFDKGNEIVAGSAPTAAINNGSVQEQGNAQTAQTTGTGAPQINWLFAALLAVGVFLLMLAAWAGRRH